VAWTRAPHTSAALREGGSGEHFHHQLSLLDDMLSAGQTVFCSPKAKMIPHFAQVSNDRAQYVNRPSPSSASSARTSTTTPPWPNCYTRSRSARSATT
jgi:hypothetical protein